MPNPEKVQDLKKEMMRRLNSLGGCVWETPRLNNGSPTIHFVWDGQYYGFYPCAFRNGGGGIKPFERDTINRLTKAGAICAIVSSVNEMEEAMNLDVSQRELKRLLPTRKMVEILKRWGNGLPVPQEVQLEILALPPDNKNAIYALYFDKMTLNQYAEEFGIQYGSASMRHQRALRMLREKLVKKHNIVGDHVIG